MLNPAFYLRFGILLGLFTAAVVPLSAQINENDPLAGVRKLISEDEVLLLWNESGSNSGTRRREVRFYDFNPGGSTLTASGALTENGAEQAAFEEGAPDIATGFFFGAGQGAVEGVAMAWRGGNNQVFLEVGRPQALYSGANDYPRSRIAAAKALQAPANRFFPQISVCSGNFFGDDADEVVLAYSAADGNIAIELYRAAQSGNNISVTLGAQFTGPVYAGPSSNSTKSVILDVVSGDFDADGLDELAVVWIKPNLTLAVNVYRVNAAGTAISAVSSQDVFQATFAHNAINLAAVAGDFNDAFVGDELAIGIRWSDANSSNFGDTRLYPMRFSTGGTPGFVFNLNNAETFVEITQFAFTDGVYGVNLAAGDMDANLSEDVVFCVGPQFFIYKMSETNTSPAYLKPESITTFSHNLQVVEDEGHFSRTYIDVGNVDNLNGNFGQDFRSEILIAKNIIKKDDISNDKEQKFNMSIYGFNTTGSPPQVNFNTPVVRNKVENQFLVNNDNDIRRYAVALGDFNGGSVLLGKPTVTTVQAVLTPLVVINAPPTHFDQFGSVNYDVCNLYAVGDPAPGGSQHFSAVYEEIVSNDFTFETNFTTDYALSTSVEAGFAAAGFSLGAKMTRTYGERFSKTQGTSSTVTIAQRRNAFLDDELLAYTVDYKLFEYPVYNTVNATPLTHIIVASPGNIQKTFTGARSETHNYRLNHQHGNLFSYPAVVGDLDLNSPGVYDLNQQEISKQSGASSGFGISWQDATTAGVAEEQSVSTEVGVNAGGAFKGFGLSASVNGSYKSAELNTRVSRYQKNVALNGFFGQGETANIPGNYNYFVKPVTYWASDGSLVLDYAVTVFNLGFWQSFYGGYDPAFLLPYQFEQEKGNGSTAESLRYRTRDILVTPFPQAGKNVKITARIHNYAFDDTPAGTPLDVCLYYHDPAAGGGLQAIGCQTITQSIRGRLNAFDSEVVETDWVIPNGLGPNTHLIGIIDPQNKLSNEIHEYRMANGISNNVGWRCLFNPNCQPPDNNLLFSVGVATDEPGGPDAGWTVYPNPTEDICFVGRRGGDTESSEVRMTLFNAAGMAVRHWPAAGPMLNGARTLDLAGLPAGAYTLHIAGERESSVVMVVKK
ncbi:MAG: T9SS type A sorting domain-containing protein [Saprospiraceae bacterium]|nr:T9SS type A sorting domain-containing protein [Saprospiraceae bacterium]